MCTAARYARIVVDSLRLSLHMCWKKLCFYDLSFIFSPLAQPSSSGRAAELLAKEGGGHVGFVGFGSMSGDLGYVPTSVGLEDQDAGLDTDFRMVLRKLSKRDIVTKLKV